MKSSGSLEQFHTIRNSVTYVRGDRDIRDFNVIVKKKDVVRDALSISDIVQCNKVPVLKHIANVNQLQKIPSTSELQLENDNSTIRNIVRSGSSINVAHRMAKSTKTTKKPTSQTSSKKGTEEDNKLALALEYMNGSREVLDSSRLMFEAALLFDEMKSYERASTCYLKSTKRVSADVIVDTYDLPCDAVYQRKVQRMSRFQIDDFMRERNALRDRLIFEETDRQRLRARASFCQLVRIFLLTHLYDLEQAQKHIRDAFQNCRLQTEHVELLNYFHVLIKTFAVSVICL